MHVGYRAFCLTESCTTQSTKDIKSIDQLSDAVQLHHQAEETTALLDKGLINSK